MGFFKILGGVALGVGAIAAAPFTGGGSILAAVSVAGSLAGTATIAAAVGAGAAGAAAGYALSKNEEEEQASEVRHAKEEGKISGEIEAKKQYEKKLKEAKKELLNWQSQVQQIQQGTKEWHAYCNQLVAMFGVGLAVAHSDGHVSPEEEKNIQEVISGVSGANFPPNVVQSINDLESNPPSFHVAVRKAEEAGVQRQIIDVIIHAVAYADHVLAPQEERLISQWEGMSYSTN